WWVCVTRRAATFRVVSTGSTQSRHLQAARAEWRAALAAHPLARAQLGADILVICLRLDAAGAIVLIIRLGRQLRRQETGKTIPFQRVATRRGGGLVHDLTPRNAPLRLHPRT